MKRKPAAYDPAKIEKKWQKYWESKNLYEAKTGSKRPKWYSLIEFPYPSADGLHVGHIRSNTAMDIISRKRRREGFEVLYPIGWDAFGLPTENYAIKTGIHPITVTKKNTDNFRKQLKALGFSFDWSREVNTSDPAYYKWTQWIFLQLYKKGLAYKAKTTVNWCPKDKTGLANEEVIDGKCERCGTPVEKREKEQWMLAITKYADRLEKDLDTVDYLPEIKTQQKNWIGRSEGAEFDFSVVGTNHKITVFTTRPDTLFGVTYVVLAPEHPLVQQLKPEITNWRSVAAYIKKACAKTDIDRSAIEKEKTGVELKGVKVVHPATKQELPVWIADYALPDYGTGAVLAVPAHDVRDYGFAKKYKLPMKVVIRPVFGLENKKAEAVHRNTISAVVRRKDGKFLVLDFKSQGWITPPIGGIDEGETPEQAAQREVLEETGFSTKPIAVSPIAVESYFYADHKKEWRSRLDFPVLLELDASKPQVEVSEEDKNRYEILWLTAQEAIDRVTFNNNKLAYEIFVHNLQIFTPDVRTEKSTLVDSGEFTGLEADDAKKKITETYGRSKISYKLRDWVFSRQRYWGEPIPMVHCDKCGWQPIPESELPLELPNVKAFQPTDTGESPLALATDWVKTTCPQCGGAARRETDTMPNWAGSSWYYLRYCDPNNDQKLADMQTLKYWLPVNWYNGGMEHVTLHLLYSRFWHKFLFDIGMVPTPEPYKKRTAHGLVLAEDGRKMSKSWGNVINPDAVVKQVGADTLRLYEMFMGPFDQAIAWSMTSISGSRRFIERVWNLQSKLADPKEKNEIPAERNVLMHQTIKKVTDDIEAMRFNTAVSAMMIYTNELEKAATIHCDEYQTLLSLLAPFAPHVTEELWELIGNKHSIHVAQWPQHDERYLKSDTVTYAIQVNGKVRGTVTAARDAAQDEVVTAARAVESVGKWITGKSEKKIIFIQNKTINFVVGE
jgi:leucyl-tRNA synthetase